MHIREREHADIKIFDLSGEMFLNEGDPGLKTRVKNAIDSGAKKLILNMELVGAMDSPALTHLLQSHTSAGHAGAAFALAAVPPTIHKLFVATHMNMVFKIYGTEEDAIAALS